MATGTFQAKLSGMDNWFLMAVDTSAGRFLKLLSGMATLAGGLGVGTIQNKNQVVVKVHRFAAPLMTLQAGWPK